VAAEAEPGLRIADRWILTSRRRSEGWYRDHLKIASAEASRTTIESGHILCAKVIETIHDDVASFVASTNNIKIAAELRRSISTRGEAHC
jgi:hypothetical protein